MPAIDKLLPRSLNQDDDERLVKSTEMTDAQNIRVSVDANEDALVLKNAWGNIHRSATIENGTMPAGTNIVIGAIGDDVAAQVYYFVYNNNNDHTIFRYDQNAKKTYIVYQDSVLNFSKEGFVTANIINLSNGQVVLYFNDSVNEPKKINATRAEQSVSGAGGYDPTFSSGTTQERTNYITVAKQPPLSPPVVTFSRNTDYPQNDIFEKNFQFAYQYEYFDGEHSALSPYSELAISKSQLKDGFIDAGARNYWNQINIAVKNSNLDVREINIYGRIGDKDSPFFLIDSVPNVNGTSTQTIAFRNDSNYKGLSALVQDKFYDNVPQKADSQAVCQGRLFFGGYTEGYNNLTKFDVDAVANYYDKPNTYELTVSKYDGVFANGEAIEIDFTNIPSTITEDSKILLSFSWNDGAMRITNTLGTDSDYNFTEKFPNIKVFRDSSGLNKISGLSRSEELEALAGIRYINDGATFKAGVNVDGVLSGPPSVRFIVQKNTSNTKELTVPIRKISDGIKVISSGFQVRKIINVPTGTTRDQVMSYVRSAIDGLYPVQFSPQESESGFSKLLTAGDTPWSGETAAFFGQGEVWLREVSRNINPQGGSAVDKVYYGVSISKATFGVNKFTFGIAQAEVLNSNATGSQFDIIESNINGLVSDLERVGLAPNLEGNYVTISRNQLFKKAIVARSGSYVTQGGSFMIASDDMDGSRCFKSGSSHELGLVYFDDKGRPSGVQPLNNEVFIKHTNDRAEENNLDGRADIVLRIKHTAPAWAERYSVVYAGKGSITNKVQYSIGGAYLALSDNTEGTFGAAQNIYLSLGTLQGRENSYDNQLGAMINYGFAEGDRVRIVRYGDNLKEKTTWNVARVTTLVADPTTNPILDRSSKAAIQNTTGDFLVIEDNNTPFWNTSSVLKGISRWNDKCVIEIYRESGAFEETFYYEVGENLSIDSNGVHETQRPNLFPRLVFNSIVAADSEYDIVAKVDRRVYKGDIISRSSGNKLLYVHNVVAVNDDAYPFLIYGRSTHSYALATEYTFTVENPDSMVRIEQGDSYFRLRTLFYGSAPRRGDVWRNMAAAFSQNAIVDFIEDPRVSDFYASDYTSLGKSFAYLPDNKRIKRYGSITYSDPFSFEGTKLGLSSFNLTTQNFKDLSYDYGSIKSLVPYDEYLYLVHERRAGIIPVGRNLLTANDGESLTATNMVVGPVKYYTGEYGVNNNPESVAWYRGYVFFVDAKAGKVIRMNYQTGLQVISEQLVDAFFKSKMFSTSTTAKNRRYRAGIDRENYEYIISSAALFTAQLSINDTCASTTASGFGRTDQAGTIINVSAVYDNTLTFDFNNDTRLWECAEENWEDAGKAMLLIDQLTNSPIIGIAEDLSPTVTGVLANIPTLMTSSAYSAFHTGEYSQNTEEVTPDTGLSGSTFTIGTPVETLPAFTIAFDVKSNYWSTRYSYIAEEFAGLSDRLYTFKNGGIYEHDPSATRNTFYGVAGDSIIECISNFNPSMVKAYEAVSLEGNNSNWTATLTNSEQTSAIASSIWQEKEGFYYAPIHQDSTNNVDYTATANVSSVSGTSEVFGIGTVSSITGTDALITFKNSISTIGFPLGNTTALYKVSGSDLVPLNLYASSINGDKILECNGTVTGLVEDDQVVMIANSAIEGDAIRDYYLKARFVNSNTSPHELYAINFIYSKSNIHNQQGQ